MPPSRWADNRRTQKIKRSILMPVKIAGVQMDIAFADAHANLEKIHSRLKQTTSAGAQLTVFPECTTTGYCFESFEEAFEYSQDMDGDSIARVRQMCADLNTRAVFGFLERTSDKRLYNSVALVSGEGVIGHYRKIHLPFLGVDRFTTSGSCADAVFAAGELNVGLNICYDSSFPEAARSLALAGADLIALPTNWPPGSGRVADFIPNARALENNVYYMSINRVGVERGFEFIGKSKICDPKGGVLATADHSDEEILYATIDPAQARQKHLVAVPGQHEVHRFKDRRPATYRLLTQDHPEANG
jgi:predicted amidohydrolase